MATSILSQSFVFDAIEAEKAGNQFPIDFDKVWPEIGHTRRDNAVRSLKSKTVKDVDFTLKNVYPLNIEGAYAIPSIIKFNLSVDGFKQFCMAANTEQGRAVRTYYIEIERAYRQQLQRQFDSPATPEYPASDRNFCNSIYKVQAMSGIKSITQIRKAIERDFVEGVDYKFFGKLLCVNTETYLKLSTKFRSAEGVDLTMLPDKLDFEACQYFKLKSNGKKNSRVAKSSAGIQLELDLNC